MIVPSDEYETFKDDKLIPINKGTKIKVIGTTYHNYIEGENNIINVDKLDEYKAKIKEEFNAMKKQGMESFMLFMWATVCFRVKCTTKARPYYPQF